MIIIIIIKWKRVIFFFPFPLNITSEKDMFSNIINMFWFRNNVLYIFFIIYRIIKHDTGGN